MKSNYWFRKVARLALAGLQLLIGVVGGLAYLALIETQRTGQQIVWQTWLCYFLSLFAVGILTGIHTYTHQDPEDTPGVSLFYKIGPLSNILAGFCGTVTILASYVLL